MKRLAFSTVEFIICITLMVVIMTSVISITFKKAKITQNIQKIDGYKICTCTNTDDLNGCELELDNTGKNEFITVQILGGGSSGGIKKGGAAGEGKIVHYPNLAGKFIIKLGKGGQYAGTNGNGGDTVIYKLNNLGQYEVFEFARGGVTNNEQIETSEFDSAEAIEKIKLGDKPTFGVDNISSSCGSGGDAQQDGKAGEVIIKW